MENTDFTSEELRVGDYIEIDEDKGTITITVPDNPFGIPFILTILLISDIETKTEFFGKRVSNSVMYACIDTLLNHTDADYELVRKQ